MLLTAPIALMQEEILPSSQNISLPCHYYELTLYIVMPYIQTRILMATSTRKPVGK
jgi:hypothetical protein